MTMAFTLTAKRLITGHGIVDQPLITVEGQNIAGLSSREAIESTGSAYDFSGDATLTAGLVDIHMHSAVGHDVMEGTIEALRPVSPIPRKSWDHRQPLSGDSR